MLKSTLTALLTLTLTNLFAQFPVFKQYTVEQGLPTNEINDIAQDSLGNLWLATDNGVCKFDGVRFQTLKNPDGVKGNTYFAIQPGLDGKLWVINSLLEIVYPKDEILQAYRYNDTILKYMNHPNKNFLDFYFDRDDNLFLCAKHSSALAIMNDGQLNQSWMNQRELTDYHAVIEPLEDRRFFQSYTRLESAGLDSRQGLLLRTGTAEIVDTVYKYVGLMQSTITPDGGRYYTYSGWLNKVEGESVRRVNHFDMQINALVSYRNNLLLGGDGMYMLKGDSAIQLIDQFDVTSIFVDHENTVWVGTKKSGLLSFPDLDMICVDQELTNPLDGVKSIGFLKDRIVLGGNSCQFIMLKGFEPLPMKHQISGDDYRISEILSHDDTIYYVTEADRLYTLTAEGGQKIIYPKQVNFGDFTSQFALIAKGLIKTPKGDIITMGNHGLWRKRGDSLISVMTEFSQYITIRTAVQISDDLYLLGTKEGLFRYDRKGGMQHLTEYEQLQNNISEIRHLNGDWLVVVVKGDGLAFIKGTALRSYLSLEELGVKTIQHVNYHHGWLWLATDKGVHRLKFDPNWQAHEQLFYTSKDGLLSDFVYQVKFLHDKAHIATQKGLVILPERSFMPHVHPPLLTLKRARLMAEGTTVNQGEELPYNTGGIRFQLEGVSLKSAGDVKYHYRMIGRDTSWYETSEADIRIPTLLPGIYQFEAFMTDHWGVKSDPVSFAFAVAPPFWRTWWFILVMVLLLSLIIWMGYRYRINQVKDRMNAAQEKNRLARQALYSQMNPHFTFNTLNSIQQYILNNDKREASKYLTRFSRLMRSVLDNSKASEVSLFEEINTIKQYLDLEKLRFGGKMEYHIEVDDHIDEDDTLIPPMIIQPYVENAIWHGMANNDGIGMIRIGFWPDNGQLICSVKDNGIGVTKSLELRNKSGTGRKSHGMNITRDRLTLLLGSEYAETAVQILDNSATDPKETGTTVIIRIPLLNRSKNRKATGQNRK